MEVYRLYDALEKGTYKSRGFTEFEIRERGKVRHIKSVHITERVVQKCLCNYGLIPLIFPTLIYDNGASQKGKGIHFSRQRLEKHLRQHYAKHGSDGYILKFDFKKYFDNIPHDVVINQINKLDLDEKTKRLAAYLIKQNPGDVGLGIGAEISQVLAISYANPIDHYIKERLQIKRYGRYMDDGYLIHPDKEYLKQCLMEIEIEAEKIGAILNKKKTQIIKLSGGFEYLKTRYHLTNTGKIIKKPNKKNVTRMRRKLKKFKSKLEAGQMTMEQINQSYQSWRAAILHCTARTTIKSMDNLYKELFGGDPNIQNQKTKSNNRSRPSDLRQEARQ